MTIKDINSGFVATIDQFYQEGKYCRYSEEKELYYIGGILQAALHILPNNLYFDLKKYIFETYGYDPGGCSDNQICLDDILF